MQDSERGLFSSHHHSNEYAHQQVYNEPEKHEAKLSHELLGGAAAFAAMKVYEHKRAKDGKPVTNALGKEALAALAGFEVDRLAETKGMDAISRHRAKKHAEDQTGRMYDAQYNRECYEQETSVSNYEGYRGPPSGGFRQYDERCSQQQSEYSGSQYGGGTPPYGSGGSQYGAGAPYGSGGGNQFGGGPVGGYSGVQSGGYGGNQVTQGAQPQGNYY